ncbi:MAG: HAD-IIB family hydrolase [Nitrospirota bacterium]
MRKKIIVFTDLDETLLTRGTYSFEPALPALKALKERDMPLVVVSSKTKAEIEVYRKKLANEDPFIAENGGGIYVPKGYFKGGIRGYALSVKDGYEAITLGASYHVLRQALRQLREEGFPIRGFGDMDAKEVARLTGLSEEEARLTLKRHFDEPFLYEGEDFERLREAVSGLGLHISQGRFYHLTGETDKGAATRVLIGLYREHVGEVLSIALGDSPADEPMLREADYPVLLEREDGGHHRGVSVPGLIMAEGVGPEGWNRAVLDLIERLG